MAGFTSTYIPVFILFFNLFSFNVHASKFYRHTAKDIRTNDEVDFNKYKDKVVLVVNVASECAYTDSNYQELVRLQDKYDANKFALLAFPCNQFGDQEPKANRHIWKYADEKFGVNFDMFTKINCVGEKAFSLYRWLKSQAANEGPTWNFSKYLLNRNGEVERLASAWVSPMQLEDDIKNLLKGGELVGGILKHENIVQKSDHTYRDEMYYKDEL